jgi:hypothetical protein
MTKESIQHNQECKSELHHQHLCYVVSQGFHLTDEQRYKDIVRDPRFACEHCGRVAKKAQNLCEPYDL